MRIYLKETFVEYLTRKAECNLPLRQFLSELKAHKLKGNLFQLDDGLQESLSEYCEQFLSQDGFMDDTPTAIGLIIEDVLDALDRASD